MPSFLSLKYVFIIASSICLLLTACGNDANSHQQSSNNKVIDINGWWINSVNGSVVKINQEGNRFTATYDRLSQKSQILGFSKGEESMKGIIKGKQINGTMKVRYPEPQKSLCPNKAIMWVPFEFFIEENDRLIKGTWEAQSLSNTCEVVETADLEGIYQKQGK